MMIWFGRNITELRRRNKMSRRELSEMIGYHENEVYLWEKDQVEPGMSAIISIAGTFRVRVDELLLKDLCRKGAEKKGIIR